MSDLNGNELTFNCTLNVLPITKNGSDGNGWVVFLISIVMIGAVIFVILSRSGKKEDETESEEVESDSPEPNQECREDNQNPVER